MYKLINKLIAWYRGRVFRKFYSIEGFIDGTDYIEFYNGVITCVSESGIRTKASWICLSWLENYVNIGVFKEGL